MKNMREIPKIFSLPLFLIFLMLPLSQSQTPASTSGYPCAAVGRGGAYPCRTYAFFRASAPNLLDLASVGDLFGVSRTMIAEPSNITSPSSAALSPNQPLLVPISCSCNTVSNDTSRRLSYAAVNFTIRPNDTFYLVSTFSFRNLTTFQAVEFANPTLIPEKLNVGDHVIFPIFCKCPNRTTRDRSNANLLISYVFQPNDTLSAVAALFGVTGQSIIDVNGNQIRPFDTIFVPVNRLPSLSQPRVSPSPPPPAVIAAGPPEKVEKKGVIVGLIVGLGICVALLILVSGLWAYREDLMRKRREEEREREEEKGLVGGKGVEYKGGKMEGVNGLGMDVSQCLDKYRIFKIEELRDATGDFDDRCLIQGSVYRGSINGEVCAIKKMKWNAYEELKILQKVNHGNLVKLEGFCIDPDDANCYLVYEYVENGSLQSWVHGDRTEKMSWRTRLRVAIDIANGLQYIHEHTRPRVVHKDIKSSNILLDSSMRAKIANFGLAKSGCNAITMHIVGTQGYIAPEYLADGVISTKMDVFSFGVVLLELISGREAIDEEGKVLWASAVKVLAGTEEEKVNKLKDWMDENLLRESGIIESAMNVMTIAVACLHKDPSKRPSMVDIVYKLCKSDDDAFFDISEEALSGSSLVAR